MNRSRAAIGTAILTSAVTSIAMLGAGPASGEATVSSPIASGLQGTFQFEVTKTQMLAAQNLMTDPPMGELTWIGEEGGMESLWEKEGTEVAGMAWRGDTIAFLTTSLNHDKPGASLMLRDENGDVERVANLHKFEKRANPDGHIRYGVRVGKSCASKLPKLTRPYDGIVESHPYAIANAPGGGWYVADAAGNTILKVGRKGNVKVVDVLGPVVVKVTKKIVKAFELDECALGAEAAFEGVPTDVEVTRKGKLVVSTLPGGPGHPALGANGSVFRINPDTGKARQLATGFVSATNVAIGKGGDIYVADLFAGRIAKVEGKGEVATVIDGVDSPAAVEWFKGQLYASIGLMGPDGGSIVTINESSISD